ncbi:hypothetical protein [Pseudomonas syringae]|nr:hypothetical protein [Pseudomonas syringae]
MKDQNLVSWETWLNNQDQWLRDPVFQRRTLSDFARRFEGQLSQLELAEMHELLDCAYWWAMEELAVYGPQPADPKDIKIWNAYRNARRRSVISK